MHPLLVLEERSFFAPQIIEDELGELKSTLAFEASAIRYDRLRQERARGTDPDQALLQAVEVANIETYTLLSVQTAKEAIRYRQHQEIFAKYPMNRVQQYMYHHAGISLLSFVVMWLVLIGAPYATLLYVTKSAWSDSIYGFFLLGGFVSLGLHVNVIGWWHTHELLSWEVVSLERYQGLGRVPDFILQRAVSIAKLAPASIFEIEYLGSDPFIRARSCDEPDAVMVYFGYWDEESLSPHES